MKKRGKRFSLKFRYKDCWIPYAIRKVQLELESQGHAVTANDIIISALEEFLQNFKEQAEKDLDIHEKLSLDDLLTKVKRPNKSKTRKITFPKQDEDILQFLDSLVDTRKIVGQKASLSEEIMKLVRIGFNRVHLQGK